MSAARLALMGLAQGVLNGTTTGGDLMKKFDVMIEKTFNYSAIVEAEDEDQATEKALRLVC